MPRKFTSKKAWADRKAPLARKAVLREMVNEGKARDPQKKNVQ